MDFFTFEFISALITIIFIDLVLAGDNAIVIGLAARNLPKHQQKKVIILGTAGAIGIRIVATIFVVWLLEIPWLLLIGGLLLIWIAYKLLVDDADHDINAAKSMWAAVWTIVVADASMGLDNVIAVAGAADGEFLLVILGLLISVPIIIWGSTLFIKVIERFPIIIYFGSGILAYTAAKMITKEAQLSTFFENNTSLKWIIVIAIVIGVLAAGKLMNSRKEKRAQIQGSKQMT
ncbi:TerC family protein [Chengkuizengella axinellae]|uniref:TerC family protein n=1 Tax=Chengkuizengella axinellae TaxID=3064388 RepID=A0ABT9IUS1_9BACL|nr:TerC family protein [Chengkuizengella sp. 2205SS18-9]MDP5273116.1 TerC family protein [Chengkuizengella sp. 2205SS18-9]